MNVYYAGMKQVFFYTSFVVVVEWPGSRAIVDANLGALCRLLFLVRYSCLTKLCPKKLFVLSQIDVEFADKEMLLPYKIYVINLRLPEKNLGTWGQFNK